MPQFVLPLWLTQLMPLVILAVGGFGVMLLDAFAPSKHEAFVEKGAKRSELPLASAVVLALSMFASAKLWFEGPGAPDAFIGAYLATDAMALFTDLTIAGGSFFAVLLAGGYLREHDLERGEFYPLVLFSAFGAMVFGRATDLLTLFIGLETMSLGVYALAAFRRTSPKSVESGLKYYLLGSFAAAILLFGMALLYGATGHTDLAGIGEKIASGTADPKLVLMATLLVIVGLAFKVSAVPFHAWTPDVYEGAPTPSTAFMSVVVKTAAFVSLLRVLVLTFGGELSANPSTGWPVVLAAIAAITMVYGNVAAVLQTSVKRMLAYSSIAHAGYILVGVVASAFVGESARSAVLFYLLAYTVSNALAFGSLILIGSRGREAVSYEDLAGVGRRHPMIAVPFVVAILSLMGFPPTGGFFAKYYIFSSAVEAGGGMIALVVLGLLSSLCGAYYYLRVLVFLFMKQPAEGAVVAIPMKSDYVVVAISVSCLLVAVMGLLPSFWIDLAVAAAK
jgi:NADH-quinone oxidoreductase subunit N